MIICNLLPFIFFYLESLDQRQKPPIPNPTKMAATRARNTGKFLVIHVKKHVFSDSLNPVCERIVSLYPIVSEAGSGSILLTVFWARHWGMP